MRSLIHGETKKTSMAASNNTTSKNVEPIQSLEYPPPIQEKIDHLKQVIQTGTPSIQLTKVKITNTRLGKDYAGESGASSEADMRSTKHGKAVANRLKALTCTRDMGNADQFTCAEPHALANFLEETDAENVSMDMKKAKVGDPEDRGRYVPPCDRICNQWVWGEQGSHYISVITPSKKEIKEAT